MELSDIEDLVRSHLIEGETMTEQPSNYFGDRMYSITTAGAPAYVYAITEGNLYGIGTLDALEAWAPGEDIAGRMIDAVLGYARRNGQPTLTPDSEEVFAGSEDDSKDLASRAPREARTPIDQDRPHPSNR